MSKKSSQRRCVKCIRHLSSNSQKNYEYSIRKYEEFHKMGMDDLIEEALNEQESGVPHHKLKIIERLESYQDYLIEHYILGTIKNRMTQIKSIYRKNRVELPYIEAVNSKRCRKRDYIEYDDILTKDEIICALNHMRLPAQARAMVMAQGGLSNEECEHLTTSSFISETYKYHQCDDTFDALKWLADENNPIIWVTKLIRIKTGKPYYAIIGAEAVNKIAEAKLYEMQLPSNHGVPPEKLLNLHKVSFTRLCIDVNNKCGFGQVAECSKFRSHMLRKFHATHIKGSALTYEEHSLTNHQIDEMQGRGKTNVQDTYIKTNPIQQKLLYAKVINNVSFHHEYEYYIEDDDVVLKLVDQIEKNRNLTNKVNELERKLVQKRIASQKVDALRDELGDDGLKELIGEILNAS